MTERVTVDPFGPEIEAFVAHMRLQERSERTVSAYLWGLKHFRRFFGDRQITTFAGITRELIEEWQYYLGSPLVGRKPLAPRSRSLAASQRCWRPARIHSPSQRSWDTRTSPR